MSINQLAIDPEVEKPNTDTLGGFTKDTGLYPATVDMAYLGKSKGGAMSLNLHLKLVSDKTIVRQTLWVTSGDAKGNKNYYINQNGKKFLLPGMVLADQIARITANKAMSELSTEEKTIKLWDRDAQAEKPTKADVITAMIGKPILIALLKIRENKKTSDGSGNYVPTKSERVYNDVAKVFYPDGYSVTEKEAGADEAKFHKQWADKYTSDYVQDDYDANVEDPTDDALPDAPAADSGQLFS